MQRRYLGSEAVVGGGLTGVVHLGRARGTKTEAASNGSHVGNRACSANPQQYDARAQVDTASCAMQHAPGAPIVG